MKSSVLLTTLVSLLFVAAASANDAASPQFQPVDVVELEQLLESQLPATGSVFLASSQLSPLAKAVAAVHAFDGPLWLYRYHVEVSLETVEGEQPGGPTPMLLVDLTRYNLGPTQHASLVEGLGPEQVAPIEEFGVGPHTSWRLTMIPLMGQPAVIMEAERRELSQVEATLADCFGQPCLQPYSLIEETAVWQAHQPVTPEQTDSVLPVPHPAGMLDLIAAETAFDPYQSELQGEVMAELLIETAGAQDDFIDVLLRHGPLLDDSLLAVWHRSYAFMSGLAGPEVFMTSAYECRRGDNRFAAPGEYCP